MDPIERQVRESLRTRADDVEPTPALWREVDRRLARRRRLRAWTWLPVAASLIAAAVAIPMVVGGDEVPRIDDVLGTDGPEETPTDPVGPDDGDAPRDVDGTDADEAPLALDLPTAPVVVAAEQRVSLVGPDGTLELATFPTEGESVVLEVAVQPGSTPDDLTAIVVTTGEGFTELRWVDVRDGEVVGRGSITEPPLAAVSTTETDVVIEGTSWSPAGDRLAWLERHRDGTGTVLRTIAWAGEPGEGAPGSCPAVGPGVDECEPAADEEVSFPVPELDGTGARLAGWVASDTAAAFQFVAPDGDPGYWVWSLGIGTDTIPTVDDSPQRIEVDEPDVTAVLDIAGGTVLRRTADGVEVVLPDREVLATLPDGDRREIPSGLVAAGDGGAFVVVDGRLHEVMPDGDVTDLGAAVAVDRVD
ncbi:hypothetical protein FTX61_10815 [Nitriliruptoraceae bacterium ZYF776]|nr:hypothetical protein [Profundirhabdus halotolerans]